MTLFRTTIALTAAASLLAACSAEVDLGVDTTLDAGDLQPLLAPGALAAVAVSSSAVELTWTDTNSNEASYEVQRATAEGGPFAAVALLPADSTIFTDSGLAASTLHFHRVRAVRGADASPFASASATTLPCGPECQAAADGGLVAATDAGSDAGSDAGPVAATDAGSDAGADAGLVVPQDAGPSNGVVGPRLSTFVESGPLVLSAGQEISGLRITTTSGPCIRVADTSGVWIHDCQIGPCGPDADGVGVSVENTSDLRVDHNAFDDIASALYVYQGGNDLVFDHNLATRLRGPMPRGQLVQFNGVHGTGNRIVCNVSDQTTPGYLDGPEDHVNIFSSGGTASSPILIAFNKIRGGGPSHSGGGLLAGDNDSAYVDITDNLLMSPGQYGVAIAGGRSFRVLRNRVYSPQSYDWSNIGMYVWNQTENTECSGHEVSGNRVFYMGPEGQNPAWNAGNCGAVIGWDTDNTWGDATLGPDMWDELFPDCQ